MFAQETQHESLHVEFISPDGVYKISDSEYHTRLIALFFLIIVSPIGIYKYHKYSILRNKYQSKVISKTNDIGKYTSISEDFENIIKTKESIKIIYNNNSLNLMQKYENITTLIYMQIYELGLHYYIFIFTICAILCISKEVTLTKRYTKTTTDGKDSTKITTEIISEDTIQYHPLMIKFFLVVLSLTTFYTIIYTTELILEQFRTVKEQEICDEEMLKIIQLSTLELSRMFLYNKWSWIILPLISLSVLIVIIFKFFDFHFKQIEQEDKLTYTTQNSNPIEQKCTTTITTSA